MSNSYSFKKITTVPAYETFVDTVLSKTQKKTPTVIRKRDDLQKIRDFYIRKVRFIQEMFDERFNTILTEFPRLDDIHPFYADLLNVLYDRDHYKVALAKISTARRLISGISNEYSRLIKYGDSLFRCKRLKVSAFGRMVKILKKQSEALSYLENVRQHLSRLPVIDPSTRTLVLCGYPNVGKSSFMNKVTRAHVDVQPYPFTTKSLYVGHTEYNYLRWQVIDTPGILDRPLEERNTIEMQAVTALAHLKSCILYFIDLSESCGYTVKQQVLLFESLTPLFSNKKIIIVFSKSDLQGLDTLKEEERIEITPLLNSDYEAVQISSHADDGVFIARNKACDMLLADRVQKKKELTESVLNRLHVSKPLYKKGPGRDTCIPETVLAGLESMETDEIDEMGIPISRLADLKANYLVPENQKYDIIPEIYNGKNIFDYVDPEIDTRLEELGLEEDYLVRTDAYNIEKISDEKRSIRELDDLVDRRKGAFVEASRLEKRTTGQSMKKKIEIEKLKAEKNRMGDDDDEITESRNRLLARAQRLGGDEKKDKAMSILGSGPISFDGNVKDRRLQGIGGERDIIKINRILKLVDRKHKYSGRMGAGDREIITKKPKYLYSGKMSNGNKRGR
eukprot:GHVP01002037.1.p1 GENE.GHVP01002037.1~~GHVP01002037.1.p1  ORF type:complete len:622 (-),score=112.32 GHVP01002037.1:17-1882(-)